MQQYDRGYRRNALWQMSPVNTLIIVINVLVFVFGCGLIPMCLIRMNNSVRFVTITKLHIPCELCRFFVESIGIVLAIPVSIIITSVMMKMSAKKVKKIC